MILHNLFHVSGCNNAGRKCYDRNPEDRRDHCDKFAYVSDRIDVSITYSGKRDSCPVNRFKKIIESIGFYIKAEISTYSTARVPTAAKAELEFLITFPMISMDFE